MMQIIVRCMQNSCFLAQERYFWIFISSSISELLLYVNSDSVQILDSVDWNPNQNILSYPFCYKKIGIWGLLHFFFSKKIEEIGKKH